MSRLPRNIRIQAAMREYSDQLAALGPSDIGRLDTAKFLASARARAENRACAAVCLRYRVTNEDWDEVLGAFLFGVFRRFLANGYGGVTRPVPRAAGPSRGRSTDELLPTDGKPKFEIAGLRRVSS
jgi:hypothetical protein